LFCLFLHRSAHVDCTTHDCRKVLRFIPSVVCAAFRDVSVSLA
jgi:hypothetical protein